jgi:hypothetical protein
MLAEATWAWHSPFSPSPSQDNHQKLRMESKAVKQSQLAHPQGERILHTPIRHLTGMDHR